jgi:hypothetical protein
MAPASARPLPPSAPSPPRRVAPAFAALLAVACGPRPLNEPFYAPHRAGGTAWAEVASPPPVAPAEDVPAPPSDRHVWLDGQWLYQRVTNRWTWEPGAWCVPPSNAQFYARPALARVRHVVGRTVRWNVMEGRYEEVDMADDRWTWARGRFYVGPSRARAVPSDDRGECVTSGPTAP